MLIRFLTLSVAMLLIGNAQAQDSSEISCRPAHKMSDAGDYITLRNIGSQYEYTYSSDSFGGPVVHSHQPVTLLGVNLGHGQCQLTVSHARGNTMAPMFYFQAAAIPGKWKIVQASGSAGPDILCDVPNEIMKQYCPSNCSN